MKYFIAAFLITSNVYATEDFTQQQAETLVRELEYLQEAFNTEPLEPTAEVTKTKVVEDKVGDKAAAISRTSTKKKAKKLLTLEKVFNRMKKEEQD